MEKIHIVNQKRKININYSYKWTALAHFALDDGHHFPLRGGPHFNPGQEGQGLGPHPLACGHTELGGLGQAHHPE